MKAKAEIHEAESVEEVADQLQQRFHKQVLYTASDPRYKIRRVSTRIPALDRVLGGGVALGRITEFYGPFSAGKSTAVWYTIAEAQSNGMKCALADTEKAFDPVYAERCGVDLRQLQMVGDAEKGEEVVDYIEWLIRSRKYGLIALDSVAALLPRAELEKTSEDSVMGRMGQLTSRMCRKLNAVNMGATAFIITNQVRDAIGVLFGNPERPTGGKAIGHFASQRIEFRQGESLTIEREVWIDGKLKKAKRRIGTVVRVRSEKDKTGPNTGRDNSFKYYFKSTSIDLVDSLVQLGLEDGLIHISGNRLSLNGGKPLMRKAFLEMLEADEQARAKLSIAVKRNHRTKAAAEARV
jgi:recombination protein RecA